ncbi:MAG: DoxX family protein [Candidatus Bathyarchaeia archaeon]
MVEPFFGVHVSVAALVLRIAVGGLFIVHGYPKLGAQQRKQGAEWMKSMGLPGGFILFGGIVEFFGGIAILLGVFTSIIASLFALWMLSTTWLSAAKMKKKFVGGYELDIILLLASLALAAIGGGILSIDHLLRI